MNYFEYLNKIMVTNPNGMPKISVPTTINGVPSNVASLFLDDSKTVNCNGNVLFSFANKDELEKVDYEKIVQKYTELEKQAENKNVEFSPLEFILKEFFNIDAVKAKADTNGDGELSVEEAKEYVEELAGKDNDANDLTLDDFKAMIQELGINLEEVFNKWVSENVQQPETQQEQAQPEAFDFQPQVGGSSNNPFAGDVQGVTPSYSAPSSNSAGQAQASQAAPAAKTLDTMTLDELNSEKETRVATLNEKQEALKAAQNGSNEKIKAAKAEKDKAKAAYEKAVKEDEAVKKYASKIAKNNEKIEKNQEKIDKKVQEISDKENEISNQENVIADLESELCALKDSLSALPAPTGKESDKENDKKIAEMKSKLTKSISNKENEIKNQKEKLEKLNKQLDALNKDKEKLEAEKVKLLEEKAALDKIVNEKASDATKETLKAFNEATKKYETVKTNEVKTSSEAVATAKQSVNEVNEKIRVAKDSQVKAENSANPVMDIKNVPASDIAKYGITEKTLPDGTKVLACRWSRFSKCQKEWLEQQPAMLKAAADLGLTLVYSDVERTVRESNIGRAKKGNLVCAGGQSPHNYGTAADIVLYKNGVAVGVNSSLQTEFANRVKQYSNNQVAWGGNWNKQGERHHFELAGWRKYKNSQNLVG